MIWRSRIREWVRRWGGAAIVIALAVSLLWMVVKHAERIGAEAVGEAMSKAARQRELTP